MPRIMEKEVLALLMDYWVMRLGSDLCEAAIFP